MLTEPQAINAIETVLYSSRPTCFDALVHAACSSLKAPRVTAKNMRRGAGKAHICHLPALKAPT
eukprot:2134184-Amphidinium_carterae.1